VVGGQRNVAVAIVCWWSHSQPGFWLLTVASGAEWLFRGLRSGGRGLGVPLRPNPVRPTPWAYDGVPGEGSIPAPLPPPPWPMQRFLRAVSVENGPISTAVSNSISGPLTPRIIPLFSEWPVSLLTSGLRKLSTVLDIRSFRATYELHWKRSWAMSLE
jgi:hypothetical protein